ncbi:methyltransferase domain-containing protein [Desmospora profundinema]|uniref:Trans-aconitate methyltransferase n=1 Tax=Desmospora profundinema TaxID=1571184 RepID=A0ABU1ITU4_9BACL|nr:methyltransferase domain-containing protein [Desmospora profundinema]MDR6227185.1 trans-aconitate methyltransferase [Desmospora profundinema]
MGETVSQNRWDAQLYDDKIYFVSHMGKGVVDLLHPQPGERILDIGCGTGDLTFEIAQSGALPVGIDLAPSMIETAKRKHPDIPFAVKNMVHYQTSEPFDAVFSNAALHWVKQASQAVEAVWRALRPGGRFVAEFGGKDNVAAIMRGIGNGLAPYGLSASDRNPWYFPSIGEYSTLLEKQGFRVTYAIHFDRPTPLPDGTDGLRHWLDMFADDFFSDLSPSDREDLYHVIQEDVEAELMKDGTWYADYRRIRIAAVKE